jgi:hypothetical protein
MKLKSISLGSAMILLCFSSIAAAQSGPATGPGGGGARKADFEGRHGREAEVCPGLELKDGDR